MGNGTLKKLIVGVGSRANFGSIKSFIEAINLSDQFDLKVLCYGTSVLDKYGNVSDLIAKIVDYTKIIKINTHVEGNELSDMTKTVALTSLQCSLMFDDQKPDFALTVGDRYETMGFVMAASLQNIPIIHTMGGEVTGTVDENLRHAITKLSHIHFVASADAYKRVIKLGENKSFVFNVGCPRLDAVKAVLAEDPDLNVDDINFLRKEGIGDNIDFNKDFLLVSHHAVTTEHGKNREYASSLIKAVSNTGIQIVYLWPNSDAGSGDIASSVRSYREKYGAKKIRFYKNFNMELYYKLMNKTACLVGNSSSGIREGAFIGTPVVNIGTRQANRERASNVIDIGEDIQSIENAIKLQMNKKYKPSYTYGKGSASLEMVRVLEKIKPPNVQKTIQY